MISPQAALKIVLNTILPNKVEKILLEDAFGKTLVEDLIADRPFPPFDRVTMDGIAIKFQEFEKGKREFEILGIQTAGEARIGAKKCYLMVSIQLLDMKIWKFSEGLRMSFPKK